MKKIIVLAISILIVKSGFSQLVPFTFGPKIGYTASKLSTKIENVSQIKEDIRSGFIGGAFARLSIKKIYLQGEAYIAFKGGKYEYTSTTNNIFNYNIKLITADIPLLLGYKLINLPMLNIRLNAGPVFSRVISRDINVLKDGVDVSGFNDEMKDNIYAIQGGLGFDITKITFDVRYELGLNNIGITTDHQRKTNIFYVTLGYRIL